MKQFTTDKVVIELTKEELNDLIVFLFDASRWNYEHNFKTCGHEAHDMGLELWKIQKELGK